MARGHAFRNAVTRIAIKAQREREAEAQRIEQGCGIKQCFFASTGICLVKTLEEQGKITEADLYRSGCKEG